MKGKGRCIGCSHRCRDVARARARARCSREDDGTTTTTTSRREALVWGVGITTTAALVPRPESARGVEEGAEGAVAMISDTPAAMTFEPEVRNSDVAVFVAGVVPVWATGSLGGEPQG